MEFFREYALLIAVAAPVAVIVAIQVFLFALGERGTLLLPSLAPFESVPIEAEPAAEAEVPRTVCEEAAKEHVDEHLERIAA
ncbi:MAG TPA: hypothetical protein VLT60_00220 [Usitatibacter sp.]|nr:hypothetical protein [Usitatibacter sp.]